MGFFGNLKQKMVGNLDVSLTTPASLPGGVTGFDGQILLTAKAPQAIKSIDVKLEQTVEERPIGSLGGGFQIGGSSNTSATNATDTIQHYTLGEIKIEQPFTMASGETKTIPFHLDIGTNNQATSDNPVANTVVKALNVLTNQNQHSTFHVIASIDVEGAMMSPSDKKVISLGGTSDSFIKL